MTEPNQKNQQGEKQVHGDKSGQQAMGQSKGPQAPDQKAQQGQKGQMNEPSKPNDPQSQKGQNAQADKGQPPKHMGAPKP
ncbi:MAG: hypothetical protein J0L92_27015 [Deltaproteobacteria bacterium]|nr:hypothetical protein [Deltaproteobacteria bacterium]